MRRSGASTSQSSGTSFQEDSFVVADSDEEEDDCNRRPTASLELPMVIDDSDDESIVSRDDEGAVGFAKSETDSGTFNSEEEDLEFLHRSQAESIIESESESDVKTPVTVRKNKTSKRRSIYDPQPTSRVRSTPLTDQPKPKHRRIIQVSDSDSDSNDKSIAVQRKNSTKMSRLSLSFENDSIEDQTYFTKPMQKEPKIQGLHKNQRKVENDVKTKNFKDSDSEFQQQIERTSDSKMNNEDENMDIEKIDDSSDDNLSSKKQSLLNKHPMLSDLLGNGESSREHNFISLLEESSDSSTNYEKVNVSKRNSARQTLFQDNTVDLTESSTGKKSSNFKNKENKENEIITCSSTSTSDNEIDPDVMAIVKKEIGVGNIDPVIAQKKQYLICNLQKSEEQLYKLKKFSTTININKYLPDKGAKVHENIKVCEKKIAYYKAEIKKLESKSNSNKSIHTSKVDLTKSPKPKNQLTTPLSNRKSKIKKESNIKNEDSKSFEQFEEINIKSILNVPETNFDTRDLGKRALETLNKQQSLTNKRLEQLHGSITTRPAEDQKEKTPEGIKIELMDHQQHALAWMKWRESQKPRGGILADDMGLGKTLTMISLILATVNDENKVDGDSSDSNDSDEWYSQNKHKRYYGGTLVVCPASLLKQWEGEVQNRCRRGLLSVLVYHGNNRQMNDRKLSKYNIVVTTYQIIVREADMETGFYKMEWNRVILDEAHYIRNHKSKACNSVCGLSAKRRWALTGTPIQNKEMDLYAVLKFLKCSPFDDLLVWKRWVDNKNDAGKQRLVTIMKTIMLRRTKQELQAKGTIDSLPDKSLEYIEINLDRDEHLVYQKILLFSQTLFAQFLAQRAEKNHVRELYAGKFDRPSSAGMATQFTKAQQVLLNHHSKIKKRHIENHEILVLLLRLRQMCCHPALIHKMLDANDADLSGIDQEDLNEDMLSQLQNMSIQEGEELVDEHAANYKFDTKVATNLLTAQNPVFDNDRRSSKVRAIIRTIKEILAKGDKMVVVSQWSSYLKIIAKNLMNVENAHYGMFTGEVAVKDRQEIVNKFNNRRNDMNILFLSLTAGGVGLNLVGGNHLLLIDIHWNPQLEAQAQDRIYRFGQKKNVYIYKFLCKETIEERIKLLQEKKLAIADQVLTGSKAVSSKLSIDDLKLLFS